MKIKLSPIDFKFKPLLLQILKDSMVPDDKDIGILLSGGVDSLTLAFGLQELGKTIHAFTFQIEENETQDSQRAREACKIFGWNFNLVKVPTDCLEDDFIFLVTTLDCNLKTQVETVWPMRHVYSEISHNHNHVRHVFSGINADVNFGMYKEAAMHFRNDPEGFRKHRIEHFAKPNPAAVKQHLALADMYFLKLHFPYRDQRLIDHFLQYSWRELNTPMEKVPLVNTFPAEFEKIGVKHHANYQLMAGIPEIFESKFLSNPRFNFKNRTRMIDVVRDNHERFKGKRYIDAIDIVHDELPTNTLENFF